MAESKHMPDGPAESPLERVERQVCVLKAEPVFIVQRTRDVPIDGGTFGGVDYVERLDGWGDLSDRDRFAELVRLDWSGVGPEDRHRLLGREVDLDGLSPATLRPFLDRDPAQPQATQPRLPSPSDILANPKAFLPPDQAVDMDRGNGREM